MLDLGRIRVCISQDGPGRDLPHLGLWTPLARLESVAYLDTCQSFTFGFQFSPGVESPRFKMQNLGQNLHIMIPVWSLRGCRERYAIIFMDDSHHYNKFFVIFKRELILDARSRAYDTMYLRPSPIWFSISMLSCKNLGHNIRGPIAQIFHLLMRYDIN